MRLRAALLAAALILVPAAAAQAGEPDATVPAYGLDLRGSDGGFRWQGRETITLTNPRPEPLASVWVRLWGNGPGGCRGRRAVRVTSLAGATAGALTRALHARSSCGSPRRSRREPARRSSSRSTSACPG